MPKTWHDRYSVSKIEDEEQKDFYRRIVADKKPYFMIYIYPRLKKQFNTYMNNTNKKCLREFGIRLEDLIKKDKELLTEDQANFIKFYNIKMPVGISGCVMNRVCKKVEEELDRSSPNQMPDESFDYSIFKSDAEYTTTQYNAINKIYKDFNHRMKDYMILSDYEKTDGNSVRNEMNIIFEEFKKDCYDICQNEKVLCNIIVDLCYSRESTKKFAWSVCGDTMIENLLKANKNMVEYPCLDDNGSIKFGSFRFSIKRECMEEII